MVPFILHLIKTLGFGFFLKTIKSYLHYLKFSICLNMSIRWFTKTIFGASFKQSKISSYNL